MIKWGNGYKYQINENFKIFYRSYILRINLSNKYGFNLCYPRHNNYQL